MTITTKLNAFLLENAAQAIKDLDEWGQWEGGDDVYDEDGELLDNWVELEAAAYVGEPYLLEHTLKTAPRKVTTWLDDNAPRWLKRQAYTQFYEYDRDCDWDTTYEQRVDRIFAQADVGVAAWALGRLGVVGLEAA